MTAVDAHYTPDGIAMEMAEAALSGKRLTTSRELVVADFCAGSGALLDAIARVRGRRPTRMVATDISVDTVRLLRATRPDWSVGRVDLLSAKSRASSPHIRANSTDVLVLNPPFSYRGGSSELLRVDDGLMVRASPAAVCLAVSLGSLRSDGVAVAVLPKNFLTSERDEALLRWIRRHWSLHVVRAMDARTFPNGHARTVLVRITAAGGDRSSRDSGVVALPRSSPIRVETCRCLDLVRGRVPMHTVGARWNAHQLVPVAHTTDIRGGRLEPSGPLVDAALSTTGPFCVVPRVGALSPQKVGIFTGQRAVLSDCVIAIRPRRRIHVSLLADRLSKDRFSDLQAAYQGSCAPYITVQRLADMLSRDGWNVRKVGASAQNSACSCGERDDEL